MKRDNRSFGTKAAQYMIAKIISAVLASIRLVPYKQRVALGGAFFQYVVSPVSKNKERILENVDHVVPELDPAARARLIACLLYTSPSPRDLSTSRMPSSA